MNRKLPLILLALAALASHGAEPILLQWGTINTDAPAAQAESVAIKAQLAKKAAATRRAADAARWMRVGSLLTGDEGAAGHNHGGHRNAR